MQGYDEDEFCDGNNDNAGVAARSLADVLPVIGAGAGASVASAGAALLGIQFQTTRCTLEELMEGKVIARKQDHGVKGSKTYIAICKYATAAFPDKLIRPRFLGAKNKEGELLNCSKSIPKDYLSNLQALKPIMDQMIHYDLKGVLNVLLVYDDHGLTYKDRWNFSSPNFSTIDISQNWN